MKEQQRILRPNRERLLHRLVSILGAIVFQQYPRERVPHVDVVADLQFLLGKREGFRQTPIVIGEEQR